MLLNHNPWQSMLYVIKFSDSTRMKFPDVTEGQLGVAINGKLTELRLRQNAAAPKSESSLPNL